MSMNYEKQILNIMDNNQGIVFTSQVDAAKIPRMYLSILNKKGVIERIARGVYLADDALDDEMFRLQSRYSKGVYSHGTALYLHGLTDRTPNYYSMTFPNKYHTRSLKEEKVKTFYVKRKYLHLGIVDHQSPLNRKIKTYNINRTIVDLIRSRNRIESGVLIFALKEYVKRKDKDLVLLMQYAKNFRVEKILRDKLEILL